LFDEQTPTLPSYLSIDFLQHDIRYHYEVGFNQQCILAERLYAINPRKSLIFERTTDTTGELARITFGKKVKVSRVAEQAISVNTLWNNTVLGGYLKTNVEITELKGVTDWFNDYLNMTVNRKTDLIKHVYAQIKNGRLPKQQLANLMNRADLSITDIHLREREETPQERLMGLMDNAGGNLQLVMEEPAHWGSTKTVEIELEHKVESGSYSLPFEAESEGTRRYFGIAGLILLLAQYPCCFPIDELEDSLHPDLYEHFLLLFLMNAKASQMIATTHNREILNERDLFRNDAIYFVDKNAAGAAEVFSLADFDTSAVRDSTNVLTAYKVGKLGGRPNLGDYYIDVAP